MKFNPFEDGKEYKDSNDDSDRMDMEHYEREGKADLQVVLDDLLSDPESAADFYEQIRVAHRVSSGYEEELTGDIKEAFFDMVESGVIMVYYDVAFGCAGLMLKMEDGTWKEI